MYNNPHRPLTPQEQAAMQQREMYMHQQQRARARAAQEQYEREQLMRYSQPPVQYPPYAFDDMLHRGGYREPVYEPQGYSQQNYRGQSAREPRREQASVPNNVMPSQSFSDNYDSTYSNRYGQEPSKQEVVKQKEPKVKEFTVDKEPYRFPYNKNIGVTRKTKAIQENKLKVLEGSTVTLLAEDSYDRLADIIGESTEFSLVANKVTIVDDSYSIPSKDHLVHMFKFDSRDLYRGLKKQLSSNSSIEELVWLDRVDKLFTAITNECLEINLGDSLGITIDRFCTDLNDLLGVVRKQAGESVSDKIEDWLDKEVSNFHIGLNESSVLDETNSQLRLYQYSTLVYTSSISYTLGLENLNKYNKLIEVPENQHLLSIAKMLFKDDKHDFILMTSDKQVYKFIKNFNDEIIITKA